MDNLLLFKQEAEKPNYWQILYVYFLVKFKLNRPLESLMLTGYRICTFTGHFIRDTRTDNISRTLLIQGSYFTLEKSHGTPPNKTITKSKSMSWNNHHLTNMRVPDSSRLIVYLLPSSGKKRVIVLRVTRQALEWMDEQKKNNIICRKLEYFLGSFQWSWLISW